MDTTTALIECFTFDYATKMISDKLIEFIKWKKENKNYEEIYLSEKEANTTKRINYIMDTLFGKNSSIPILFKEYILKTVKKKVRGLSDDFSLSLSFEAKHKITNYNVYCYCPECFIISKQSMQKHKKYFSNYNKMLEILKKEFNNLKINSFTIDSKDIAINFCANEPLVHHDFRFDEKYIQYEEENWELCKKYKMNEQIMNTSLGSIRDNFTYHQSKAIYDQVLKTLNEQEEVLFNKILNEIKQVYPEEKGYIINRLHDENGIPLICVKKVNDDGQEGRRMTVAKLYSVNDNKEYKEFYDTFNKDIIQLKKLIQDIDDMVYRRSMSKMGINIF